MRKPFTCLLTVVTSLLIATPAFARCEDSVSFMVNQYGQCVDLANTTPPGTTTPGIPAAQKEYIPRKNNPLLVKDLRLEPSQGRTAVVTARVLNRSSQTVPYALITLRFERKRDTNVEVVDRAGVTVQFLEPGKEISTGWIIENPGPGISNIVVEAAQVK
jgi:hypothetical protein